jgi:tRNA-Thr(GGU) m(6)t(6)A37 methyltransferase TsaA
MTTSSPSSAFTVHAIGVVRSRLTDRKGAPRQGYEGAPDACVEVRPEFLPALLGINEGDDILLLTWLHGGQRDVLQVHPRKDPTIPLAGVFATRSPDRPNPIGLHRVRVQRIERERWLYVGPLEAIDGTPVVDIKAVLERSNDS